VPGSPKERVNVPAGMSFYQWLSERDFFSDIEIVVNGKPLDDSDELDFPLTEMHSVQIFSQPKGAWALFFADRNSAFASLPSGTALLSLWHPT